MEILELQVSTLSAMVRQNCVLHDPVSTKHCIAGNYRTLTNGDI